MIIVSPNRTRCPPDGSGVESISGEFETAKSPAGTSRVIPKTAFASGSS